MFHDEIKLAVKRRLRAQHVVQRGTLIRDEMGICLGETRIDVVAINGKINGYEIKGDRDRLNRLERQIELYSRVTDSAVLVTEGRFAQRALDLVPAWWGVWKCLPNGRWPHVEEAQVPGLNLSIDPLSVAQLLWRDEALAVLTSRGLDTGLRTATRWRLWDALVTRLPLDELGATVREALRVRARRGW